MSIRLKHSTVSGKVPTTSDLVPGELAINSADGKVFLLKSGGTPTVVEIGGSGGTAPPQFTFAAAPPTGVTPGHRWCDANTGIVYTFLDDGTSTQWVELEARSRIT